MNTSTTIQKPDRSKGLIGISVLTAIAASLCCITPVLAFIAGVSGMASAFSWMEPARPYLVGITLSVLGFAWYQKLKTADTNGKAVDCSCEDGKRPSFWRSKKFLGLVTAFAGLMLAFPGYGHIFYPNNNDQNTLSVNIQDSTKQITIQISGMTCAGCEAHIENTLTKLPGVVTVDASYKNGTAVVNYLPEKVQVDQMIDAINKTGYKVAGETSEVQALSVGEFDTSFYQVPLVCMAAPSIGCGSRSKPVLLDLEKSEVVEEAWLNRQGNVICVVWSAESVLQARNKVINEIFSKRHVDAYGLLMNDYSLKLDSFTKKDGWYRAQDVDKLSQEEAQIIAGRLLKAIKEKADLSSTQEMKLKEKITDSFYDFFLHFISMDELNDPEAYKAIFSDIRVFGEDLLGKNKMPNLDALWSVCLSADKSCNHEGCSSSCKLIDNQ